MDGDVEPVLRNELPHLSRVLLQLFARVDVVEERGAKELYVFGREAAGAMSAVSFNSVVLPCSFFSFGFRSLDEKG